MTIEKDGAPALTDDATSVGLPGRWQRALRWWNSLRAHPGSVAAAIASAAIGEAELGTGDILGVLDERSLSAADDVDDSVE